MGKISHCMAAVLVGLLAAPAANAADVNLSPVISLPSGTETPDGRWTAHPVQLDGTNTSVPVQMTDGSQVVVTTSRCPRLLREYTISLKMARALGNTQKEPYIAMAGEVRAMALAIRCEPEPFADELLGVLTNSRER